MTVKQFRLSRWQVVLAVATILAFVPPAQAQNYTILHTFTAGGTAALPAGA